MANAYEVYVHLRRHCSRQEFLSAAGEERRRRESKSRDRQDSFTFQFLMAPTVGTALGH